MAKKFDPYEKWFNIPPSEQPPDHYRLLGIQRFEADTSVIDEAAEARAAFLHDVATGPQIAITQRLLNEVAAARLCLTDSEKKADYDARLQRPRKAARKEAPNASLVQPPNRPMAIPVARPIPPRQDEGKNSEFEVVTDDQAGAAAPTKGNGAQRRAATPWKKIKPVWIAAGASVSLVIVIVAVAASSRRDSKAKNSDDETQTQVAVGQENLADAIKQHNAGKPDLRRVTPNSALGTFGGTDNPAAWSFGFGLSDSRVVMKGLVLWLDASEKSTVLGGRPFNSWTDKSGSGNDAILPIKASPPRHRDRLIQGHAAMQFDGGELLSIKHNNKLNLGANYTIVFVAAGEGTLISKGNTDGGQANAIALRPDVSQLRFGKNGTCAAKGDNPSDLKVRIIVATPQAVRWFVDGQPGGEYQGAHEIKNNAALQIGGATKGKPRGRFNGKLAELLIYNRPLDDNERQSLEQYLNEKWLHSDS